MKNKVKFTVLITNNPFGANANNAGYLFTKALLTHEEVLSQVFFYQNGVFAVSKNVDFSSGETSINQCWEDLKQEFGNKLSLVVCTSSALRRGINEHNILDSFTLGSISQLFDATDNIYSSDSINNIGSADSLNKLVIFK